MKTLYVNTEDKQGGTWAVGVVEPLKGWREIAMGWADSDESYGLVRSLKRYEIKNSDLIDFINDYWSINIVHFDENNPDHVELKNYRDNNWY